MNQNQPSILFVDDDPEVLNGLRRLLRSKRRQWRAEFAQSGHDALALMEKRKFEVVVSDMRMPRMDGAELLSRVRAGYPSTIRIILSGQSDDSEIIRSVKPAHQYLAKPVDPKKLFEVLVNAFALSRLLDNQALAEMLARADSLPAMPQVYTRLLAAIENQDSSLEEIGRIVEQDMGMTATILKITNSAFFGIPRQIRKPAQAVSFLGLDVLKSLVLSYQLFSTFDLSRVKGLSFESLWQHSVTTAALAKKIAEEQGLDRKVVEDAFFSGMLHDVGKLPLCSLLSEDYQGVMNEMRRRERPLWQIENDRLGVSHAEAGAFLMGLWGMPSQVLEAITFHHRPGASPEAKLGPLLAVHVADALEHELAGASQEYLPPKADRDYLARLGLEGRLDPWRRVCGKIVEQQNNGD